MIYYIANKDFGTYKAGDIALRSKSKINHLTSPAKENLQELHADELKFAKTIWVEEKLEEHEFWHKDEQMVFKKPLIEDDSWVYCEIENHWSKDEQTALEQPMIEDNSWTHSPEEKSIPAHFEIVEDLDAKEADEKEEELRERKRKGAISRQACESVLDLIAGYNIERKLTTDEIIMMKINFTDIGGFLKDGQAWAAKKLICELEPDGEFVTKEMLTTIIQEFERAGV